MAVLYKNVGIGYFAQVCVVLVKSGAPLATACQADTQRCPTITAWRWALW